jgi:hypothetical protein
VFLPAGRTVEPRTIGQVDLPARARGQGTTRVDQLPTVDLMTDDDDFDDAEEQDFDSDWQPLHVDGRMELESDWVSYLAQNDPPSEVEGYDPGISDYEHSGQDVHYG